VRKMICSCPDCGSAGVPLIFGLPVPEARAAAQNGDLALGGCLMPALPPNWQCPHGHQWHDDDETGWNARLMATLVAHGYREY
jgi:hypothetical protein